MSMMTLMLAATVNVTVQTAVHPDDFKSYDTAKIRANYQYYAHDAALLKKASVFSALQLYLDFINLFLYILRILGRRRERNGLNRRLSIRLNKADIL